VNASPEPLAEQHFIGRDELKPGLRANLAGAAARYAARGVRLRPANAF
jgi:hypothetical protein